MYVPFLVAYGLIAAAFYIVMPKEKIVRRPLSDLVLLLLCSLWPITLIAAFNHHAKSQANALRREDQFY